VVQIFTDNDIGASEFSKKNRPAFDEMTSRFLAGEANCLIAYDQSRITRRPTEFENLLKMAHERQIRVVTVQGDLALETADQRLVARNMAANSSHAVEKMSERIKSARQYHAENGKRFSPIRTYGYRADKITADPVESKFVRQMIQRAIDGQSCTQIAKWLNESGQRTVKGTLFQSAGVKKIIVNPMIAGLQVYRGEILPDVKVEWDALVEVDEWRKAGVKVKSRTNGRRGNPGTLLMGVVFCSRCGNKMYRDGNKTGSKRDGNFRCKIREIGGCGLGINAPKLESLVTDAVLVELGDLKTKRRSAHQSKAPKVKDDAQTLRAELDRFAKDRGAGLMTDSEWRIITDGLRERLRVAELDEFSEFGSDGQAMKALEKSGKTLKDEWSDLPLNIRQRLIGLVVDRVEILKGDKGKHFSPDRVKILWKV
jgi:DNA invertase Pin-like site-specific DNA recombinase